MPTIKTVEKEVPESAADAENDLKEDGEDEGLGEEDAKGDGAVSEVSKNEDDPKSPSGGEF